MYLMQAPHAPAEYMAAGSPVVFLEHDVDRPQGNRLDRWRAAYGSSATVYLPLVMADGLLGDDEHGRFTVRGMRAEGIDISSLLVVKGENSPFSYVITALGMAQILAWGTSFYFPAVFAGPIVADTGWSLGYVVGGTSVGLMVAGLISPQVGRVIDFLQSKGLLDRTIITVLGDHGESLGDEHDGRAFWSHGGPPYEEQVRVPLIFRAAPGL